VLLLPAARFAWQCRSMPEFGYLHDDGILFVSARSMAHGDYRIESLPESPAQTKYPPLYPFYLSFIWRVDPHFPENLPVATAFSFALLPVFFALCWRYYRRWFSEPMAGVLMALLAINPFILLFGCTMFSEVFFMCWLLAVFLAVGRPGVTMALAAGALAGCAYLARTAGIALLVSAPALLLWKREYRRAAAFVCAMLPFVAGWTIWTHLRGIHSSDATLAYYTDYLRFQLLNVGPDNFFKVVLLNFDRELWSMGALIFRDFLPLFGMNILTRVTAVAMIAGLVRLFRRNVARQYIVFAAVSALMLAVWHYPPTERFLLPLFPLLLAGLVTELLHLGSMIRDGLKHKDAGQRAAAGALAAVAAGLALTAVALNLQFAFQGLARSAEAKAHKLEDLRQAYAWIEKNLPPSATLLSYDDPLLYLYTGRRGNTIPIWPRWWYAEDTESMVGAYKDLRGYCRRRGLQYVLFTKDDTGRELGDQLRERVQEEVQGEPGLTPLYRSASGIIYKVD